MTGPEAAPVVTRILVGYGCRVPFECLDLEFPSRTGERNFESYLSVRRGIAVAKRRGWVSNAYRSHSYYVTEGGS